MKKIRLMLHNFISIMQKKAEYTKTELGDFWEGTILGRFIIGPNIFCSVDRQWKKQRKVLQSREYKHVYCIFYSVHIIENDINVLMSFCKRLPIRLFVDPCHCPYLVG